MTSGRIFFFGSHPWSMPSNLNKELQGLTQPHHRQRNRLKQPVPQEQLHYSDALWDIVVRSNSYINVNEKQSSPMNICPDFSETQFELQPMRSQQYSDSMSLYSRPELEVEPPRRRRAKTPVHRIGQLEEKARLEAWKEDDMTTILAKEYQDELPTRCWTPYSKEAALNPYRNSLRRMKRHESLRDMVNSIPEDDQATDFTSSAPYLYTVSAATSPSDYELTQGSPIEHHIDAQHSSRSRFLRDSFESYLSRRNSSDSETLVGSDSETSPISPGFLSASDLEAVTTLRDCKALNIKKDISEPTSTEGGVGMQLCLDLLTNGLATALYKQHPTGTGNRSSELQILLMIEAYEGLQEQIRKEMLSSRVRDFSEDQVKTVEGTLDHWLQALRSIYDRYLTQDRGTTEVHRISAISST